MRRWELVAEGSAKFWEIGREGASVTARYGRLGSVGQTRVKDFASEASAVAQVDRLVAQQVGKGYLEVGAAPAEPAASEWPDETVFVIPPSWRAVVRPRRGRPGPQAVKPARGAEDFLRAKVEPRPRWLSQALTSRRSEPELVRAALSYLDGRATPLGAAAVGATLTDEASRYYGGEDVHALADAWVLRHGFEFAAQAVSDLGRIRISLSGSRTTMGWRTHHAQDWPSGNRQVVSRFRTLLAGADEQDYRAAVEALSTRRDALVTRTIAAYLAPTRHDWADELFADVMDEDDFVGEWRLFLSSLRTAEQVGAVLERPMYRSRIIDRGVLLPLVDLVGPGIAPVVAGLLDDDLPDDHRKLVIDVLAWTPTDEAFELLVARVDERFVLPAVIGAAKRYPVRGLKVLAAASGSAAAKSLLVRHVEANPDLVAAVLPELDGELRAVVERAAAEEGAVPDTPAELLPPLLVAPPWTVKRTAVKPVVAQGLLGSAAVEFGWEPNEREAWAVAFGDYYWADAEFGDWKRAVRRFKANRLAHHEHPPLFVQGPEEVLRPLLASWQPELWSAMDWIKPVVARYELDALPVALAVAKFDPPANAAALLPFGSDEIAHLMADWWTRLKSARAVAVEWFGRHPETAARALLPAALGKPGKARRVAEAALRLVAVRGHADVLRRVAAEHGEQVEAAVSVLADRDPLDHLPSKVPVVGDWADPALLPRVLLRGRRQALPVTAAGHVLTMLAMSAPDDVYAGVEVVREVCDPESLARFAWAVLEAWRANGAPPKDGWVLAAQGLVGDDETVRALAPVIRAWPGEGGHAKAVAGLGVLAAIGTDVALAHLDGIARKVRFGALKARAREMIESVAADLGLTGEQLADRLVPDFGLDDAATLVVDYGPRRFVVGFDEQLKPYVVDGDGKRRKDLPKPGAKDDPELAPAEHKRFATLKKDVRTVAADQIRRFEAAMVARRRWSVEEFRTLFAGHPLLWHVARRLVWTTGDGLGFRLAEDRTVADVHDEVVDLPRDAVVGIAHPLELGESLAGWAEVFADYEILQPFPQLGRPVHALTEDERAATSLKRFQDVKVPVGKLLGLTGKGWRRGEPQDAGMECWITRPVPGGGAVVVNLDPGIAVGVVTMFAEQRLTDIRHDVHGAGWHRGGERPFGDLDPITASEVLAELTSLTS